MIQTWLRQCSCMKDSCISVISVCVNALVSKFKEKSLNTFRMANILSQDYNTIGDYKLLSQIVSVILSGIHPLCQFTSNFQVCWHSCLPSHSVLLWRYLWYLSLGFGCALGLRLSVQFDCPWHLFHHEENMVNVFPAVVNSADAVIFEFLCKQAGCHPDNLCLSFCLSVKLSLCWHAPSGDTCSMGHSCYMFVVFANI